MGRITSKAGTDRSRPHHEIRFPQATDLSQDREYCEVLVSGEWRRIRFHDYDSIFEIPGLYEQIFYDQLGCHSHERIAGMLADVLEQFGEEPRGLRVLELGAGNGVVGQRMRDLGVGALAGLDISAVARKAALRDRPGVYDQYFVADLGAPAPDQKRAIEAFGPNALVAVACLGFGDMQTNAFRNACAMLPPGGWLVLNAKHEFVNSPAPNSVGALLKGMTAQRLLEIHSYTIYTHRMSVDGRRLHYAAMVGRKPRTPGEQPPNDVMSLVRARDSAP